MFKKIIVAYDGSEMARRAFAAALDLAKQSRSELHILSVVESLPRYAETTINDVDEMEEKVKHHFEEVQKPAIEEAAKAGVPLITHTQPGHAARALVDYVTEVGGDLLVLGHSGHSSLWGTFLGTTADKVVRHAPCSVLVVR